jgi:quercetin dioxygenase-like cupin family protein
MRVRTALYGVVLCFCFAPIVSAQDATKVDPKHYTVVSENDQVRIVKIHYGPHEKSVMHSHPASVVVPLTGFKGTFTYADGKKEDMDLKAGAAQYSAATTHLPENTGDAAFDAILVELKGPAAKAAMARKVAKPAKAEKM